ncbi:RND efflux system outer membrane lipoprotein [Caballeronia humi]|uniref:RND efflux system outer membrane lipoprotein n=1 Tax=Caballeronia humi TaxID=326474 RepID=A0A158GLA1_9BURK|nr:RND efflux system outer membrane lipoprotein [Caballeronia humi]
MVNASDNAQASEAVLEVVRLAMRSDLARHYFLVRALEIQKKFLDDSVTAYAAAFRILQQQVADGAIDASAAAQAQTQRESTRLQATDIDVQIAQTTHAIAIADRRAGIVVFIAAEDRDDGRAADSRRRAFETAGAAAGYRGGRAARSRGECADRSGKCGVLEAQIQARRLAASVVLATAFGGGRDRAAPDSSAERLLRPRRYFARVPLRRHSRIPTQPPTPQPQSTPGSKMPDSAA